MQYYFLVVDRDTNTQTIFTEIEKAVEFKQGLEITDAMNGFTTNYFIEVIPEKD